MEIDRAGMIRLKSLFFFYYVIVWVKYLKSNFPMSPHVRLFVGSSVGRSVCHTFLKGQKVILIDISLYIDLVHDGYLREVPILLLLFVVVVHLFHQVQPVSADDEINLEIQRLKNCCR